MQDDIKKILEYGVMAPSGDNSQPWKFKVFGNTVECFMDSNIDNPILNFKKGGTLIAHGSLLENIILASSKYGYETKIELEPSEDTDKTFTSTFIKKKDVIQHELFNYIEKRHTNRKPYRKRRLLTKEEKHLLLRSSENVRFFENKEDKATLARISAFMERIALQTKSLHNLFFKDIFFDREKNTNGKKGLYIKTLELPMPIQLLFRFLKNWSFTKALNKLGFYRLASGGNENIYKNSSAIGLILVDDFSKTSMIRAGRDLEKIWLTATSLELSLQPITGITFIVQRFKHREYLDILNPHKKLLEEASNILKKRASGKEVALMFRIGKSKSPTSVSKRRPPIIHNLD